MPVDPTTKRAIRAAILKLVYQKHERQEHRYFDESLLNALDHLSFVLYLDIVRELLQDLSDRGYLSFSQVRHRKTGEVTISEIQLTPAGRDIVEEIRRDPAVGLG